MLEEDVWTKIDKLEHDTIILTGGKKAMIREGLSDTLVRD